jgi:hypothetical protein
MVMDKPAKSFRLPQSIRTAVDGTKAWFVVRGRPKKFAWRTLQALNPFKKAKRLKPAERSALEKQILEKALNERRLYGTIATVIKETKGLYGYDAIAVRKSLFEQIRKKLGLSKSYFNAELAKVKPE